MVAIALAVIVGGIAVFVTVLARQGDVEIRLGDDRFDAGIPIHLDRAGDQPLRKH